MEEKVRKLLEKHKDDKDLTTEKDYIKPGWDWSGADLSGCNLEGLRLSNSEDRANFEKADLRGANLQKADLQNADLRWAKLQNAYLSEADLRNADLSKADLQNAELSLAKLQNADLSYAKLQGADLFGANLQGSKLRGANLQNANLGGANLQKVDLERANLQEAKLWDANLQKANLTRANLQEADLIGANLQEADLNGANLREAEFDEKTALHNANLFQCKLENSTLRNAYKNLDKVVIQEKNREYSKAKDVYLILKNYFRQEGMYDESGKYYYREKLMETKCFWKDKRIFKWLENQILHKIAGFGERPLWVLLWWVGIILISALLYWLFNGIMINGNTNYVPKFLESIYFSGVTFTTLGFGDLAPKPGIFQLFALGEALLGAIFMAMFIFVFARKMIR